MRLVIDMQGAQTPSRLRDIGRCSIHLVSALLAAPRGHEVLLLVNEGLVNGAAALRTRFAGWLAPEAIVGWEGPGLQDSADPGRIGRREAAELLRAGIVASLRPDVLLVSSVFEGWADDAVTAWPDALLAPVSAAICDEVDPWNEPEQDGGGRDRRDWFGRQLRQLRRMDALLAISEGSRNAMVDRIGVPAGRVSAILADTSPSFRPAQEGDEPADAVAHRYGLRAGYVLVLGGRDDPGDRARLIRAFMTLPAAMRTRHPLVVTADSGGQAREGTRELAGPMDETVMMLDRAVSGADLPGFCRAAAVVLPSPGYPMPALMAAELTACGVATLVPEGAGVIGIAGRGEGMFDPRDEASIAARLFATLEDATLRNAQATHGVGELPGSAWARAAERAWDALEAVSAARPNAGDGLVSRPTLAVVLPSEGDEAVRATVLAGVTRTHAVTLLGGDPGAGERHWSAWGLPRRPLSALAAGHYDRVLFVLGNDPEGAVLACRAARIHPVMVAEGGIALLDLLHRGRIRPGQAGRQADGVLLQLQLDAGGWAAVIGDADAAEAVPDGRFLSCTRWEMVADWGEAIERCWRDHPVVPRDAALRRIAAGPAMATDAGSLRDIAASAARELWRGVTKRPGPALFLDVSSQAEFDAGTGIQRVVREVVRQLLPETPKGFRTWPVVTLQHRFDEARRFALRMVARTVDPAVPEYRDRATCPLPGDVFVALDLRLQDIDGLAHALRRVRAAGGRTVVVVYDLLPVLRPDCFVPELVQAFSLWLEVIAREADGLLCISRAVAAEVRDWLDRNPPQRDRPLSIGWFHLGADALPDAEGAPAVLPAGLDARPAFLMVGTVEPRKGHAQALAAFERLWADGIEAGLVVVGKAGWQTEALVARMRGHPERGRRLLWIEDGSDALVAALYRNCSALLMASEGEGFGLPLVEAAYAGLPVIARRLPVFEEVAGTGVTWFEGTAPEAITDAVRGWLDSSVAGTLPDPASVPTLGWAESSLELARIVLDDAWQERWTPPAL